MRKTEVELGKKQTPPQNLRRKCLSAGGGLSYPLPFFLLGNFQTELLHALARRSGTCAQAVDREVMAPLGDAEKAVCVQLPECVPGQLLPDTHQALGLPDLLRGRPGRKMFRN